ncbi:MAG: TonB-dependent receptor [Myxococcota bacterium]
MAFLACFVLRSAALAQTDAPDSVPNQPGVDDPDLAPQPSDEPESPESPAPEPPTPESPAPESPAPEPPAPESPESPSPAPESPAPGEEGSEQAPSDPAEEPAAEGNGADVGDAEMFTLDEDAAPEAEERAAAARESDGWFNDGDLTLREVVVAYTPNEIFRLGGSATLIGEEELETLEYDDPHSVLLSVPGLYVRTEDGFGLRPNIGLRGGNPERSRKVTLMEEGVLFGPAPYAAPAAYYFPLMTRITGVEVFKGPAALLYGPQTIGGAVNLQARQIPVRSAGGLDLSYGRFRTRKAHFHYGASNRWGGFLFEGLDIGTQGFKDIDNSTRTTGFHRTDFLLRGFLQTDPNADIYNRFELKLGFGRERSNETYTGLTREDFDDDPYRRYASTERDRMRWWRTSVQLNWRLDVGDHVTVNTQVYRHDFERSWRRLNRFGDEATSLRAVLQDPTGRRAIFYDVLSGAQDSSSPREELFLIDNDRRFVSQGGQTRVQLDFETGPVEHHVEAGFRFHQDQIDRDHAEEGFRMVEGSLVPNGDDPNQVTDNFGWAFAFAGYLVYGVEVAGLTVTPGIRTEVVKTRLENDIAGTEQEETRSVVLPGIGAQYSLTPEFGILAGVHRGYSPVSPGQEAEVDPELSVNYELGVRYSAPEEGRLVELVGFFNNYSNLTGQCAFSTGCTPEMLDRQFNGGDVFVWGIESIISWTFEIDRWQIPVRATYTYTGSSFRSDFDSDDPTFGSVQEGDELPYVPEHQGQLQIGVEHPKGGARAVATYVGEMREEASQGGDGLRTDDFVMMDLVGWWQLRDELRVYTRLENLLNQQPVVATRPFGARPLRPFSVHLGVKLTF